MNSYYKFAFIREPKSWFKSQYVYNLDFDHVDNEPIHLLLNNTRNLQFNEDKSVHLTDSYTLRDPENKVLLLNDCILFYVLLDRWFKGSSMNNYIDLEIDFIGTIENINEDIKYIFNKIGIKQEIKCPILIKVLRQNIVLMKIVINF